MPTKKPKSPRKTCRKCGKLKDREEFVKDKTRADGIYPWCKECHIARQKEYRKEPAPSFEKGEDRECPVCLTIMVAAHHNRRFCSSKCKDRAARLKIYGFTPEDFRKLTASGKCPICLRSVQKWCIDHNHVTGEVMGPVCDRCNQTIIAGSNHNPEFAQRLLEYLTKSPVRQIIGERRYIGPEDMSQIDRIWAWSDEKKS